MTDKSQASGKSGILMMGRLYGQCKELVVKSWLGGTGRLAELVDAEFHPMFTFVVTLLFQLLYLRWLMSGGSLADYNFLHRYFFYLHVAAFLVLSALLRCSFGYVILGQHLQPGRIFDHEGDVFGGAGKAPNGNGNANGNHQDNPDKSIKSNKDKQKDQQSPPPPPSALSDPESEDDAKISKDFGGGKP